MRIFHANMARALSSGACLLVALAHLFAPAAQPVTTTTSMSTLTGNGTGAYSGDGGAATNAQVWEPAFLAYDAAGNLLIADRANHRVRRISAADGKISTIAGTGARGSGAENVLATASALASPSGIAVDSSGNIYIVDQGNNRIRKINVADGKINTIAGTGAFPASGAPTENTLGLATAMAPDAIAVADGVLYFSEMFGNRVRKMTLADSRVNTVAGTSSPGYNGDNIAATTAQLNYPLGIAVNSSGLFIAEYGGHRVRKVATNGTITTIAGTGTAGYNGDGVPAVYAQLKFPTGLALDSTGNVYVGIPVDQGGTAGSRVRRIATDGNIYTVTGTGVAGFSGDGSAAITAQVKSPYGLATAANGDLVIADIADNRVRKVSFIVYVPAPPTPVSVNPAGGTGTTGNFDYRLTDTTGATSITSAMLQFAGASGICVVSYTPLAGGAGTFNIFTGFGWQSAAPGGTVSTDKCTLSAALSTSQMSGNEMRVTFNVTFDPALAGPLGITGAGVSAVGSSTWVPLGNWTVPGSLIPLPEPQTVAPASGTGASGTFTFTTLNQNGAANLDQTLMRFANISNSRDCEISWVKNLGVYLRDATAPGGWLGPLAFGTPAAILDGTNCSLNVANSSLLNQGNLQTIVLSMNFKPVFGGDNKVYLTARNATGFSEPPKEVGTWTVPGQAPVPQRVDPNNGSGNGPLTFSFTTTNATGAADITRTFAWFESLTGNGNCQIAYVSPGTFQLLSDDGQSWSALPAGSSSSIQNSSCILQGTGTGLQNSNVTQTMVLNVAFKPAFVGDKRIWLAAEGSGRSAWANVGLWSVPGEAPAPQQLSPNTGSGYSNNFALVTTHSAGGAMVQRNYVTFASQSGIGMCQVGFVAPSSFYLWTDANSWSAAITPGSGSVENSYCTLNGAGTGVANTATAQTLNLNLTFKSAFVGLKSIYNLAGTIATYSPLTQVGTWTVPGNPPVMTSVTPNSGSGPANVAQPFRFTITTASPLQQAGVWIASETGSGSCVISWTTPNTLSLLNDAFSAYTPVTAGSTVENSACVLAGTGSGMAPGALAGTQDLTLNLTFKPAFGGTKGLYASASNIAGQTGWTKLGTWTIDTPLPVPVSVDPSAGSSANNNQTFAFATTHAYGAASVTSTYAMFTSYSGEGLCVVGYNSPNTFLLLGDAGGWQTLSGASVSNSYCTLNTAGTAIQNVGNTQTARFNLTFNNAFVGFKGVYLSAGSLGGSAPWTPVGTWTVNGVAPTPQSANPANGSGTSGSFAFTAASPSPLTGAQVAFTGSSNACNILFQAPSSLYLMNDAGTSWGSAIQMGSGSLTNTYCTVSGSGSSIQNTGANTSRVLTLNLSFKNAFVGDKTMMFAASSLGGSSSWVVMGNWRVPATGAAPIPIAVTPPTGQTSGLSGTFRFSTTNAAGVNNITRTFAVFGPLANGAGQCQVMYDVPSNNLYLLNDAGNGWVGPSALLSGAALTNSRCSVNPAQSSLATVNNDTQHLSLAMTFFSPAFRGTQPIYLAAMNNLFLVGGWTQFGSWIVP